MPGQSVSRFCRRVSVAIGLVAMFLVEPVQASLSLTVLHTGGLAGRAEHLMAVKATAERLREAGESVLLVDAGNALSPFESAVSHEQKTSFTIDLMNAAGYRAWLPSRLDLDHSQGSLTELLREARFPIVGANLLRPMTGRPPFQVQPYAIVPVGRIRVGVLGVGTAGGGTEAADPIVALRHYLPTMVKRADLVIVLSQAGPEADSLLAAEEGVTVVIGNQDSGGDTIGRIAIAIDDSGRTETDRSRVPLESTAYVEDAIGYLEGWAAEVQGQSVPVTDLLASCDGGFGPATPSGSAMGFLVADLMRTSYNTDVGLVSARSVNPALSQGPVRVSDLLRIYPGDDEVAVFKVEGAELMALIEGIAFQPNPSVLFSGIQAAFRGDAVSRKVATTVNEQEIDPKRTYRVSVESGALKKGGAPASLVRDKEQSEGGARIRDLLAGHIRSAGVIRGSDDGRLTPPGTSD